jgi:PmbA protein
MTTEIKARSAGAALAHEEAQLREIAADVLQYARAQGASAAEAEVSEGVGQTVTVRCGEVETIEYNRDKGIGVSVYFGKRRGHASTSDFSSQAVRATVDAAVSIARFTASDDYAGLADEALLAREIPDLDLFHPWNLLVEDAIEMAQTCESAAFDVSKKIDNSEGATVSSQHSHFAYGNSLGFLSGYPSSQHWISCAVIAGKGDAMQRDDWYSSARDASRLDAPALIGRTAGERAVRRLGAKKISTMQVPVLFEAPVAASLIGHFVSAVSGGSLYRKSSFLLDSLGKEIFAPWIRITEDPHIRGAMASGPFDEEGVATKQRSVVEGGVVQGYFLGSYSARKLGMQTTGNAGGCHNLLLADSGEDFAALLRKMGRGLLVTELMGQGINMVTGDYSRGAAGFWVENGEITHAVEEITIAGNLKDIFRGIIGAGTDVLSRGSKHCGSILIDRMTVAGE